ncbi:GAF domain-containing protein [Cryobacterium sp. PH29-G1]|uniref:GAF domain-containing protein n=1 Tax=Cryobacterium sp. PH29-G1 TaxID=3046211 RepID=UPI0024B9304B|nr:GAF domain-containing protein [Cryobacterium sp. PH29-G1]MDJ0350389.1 transcriptional regulator [Cryobacterium sp. PH29-G1]
MKSTSSVPSGPARENLVALERAHESAVNDRVFQTGVRQLVQDSWQRSLSLSLNPAIVAQERTWTDAELRDLRNLHPLAAVLPVVHSLLIRHAFDAELLVAIGDESGRLLWIDGDRVLRRQVEEMLFVEGADWSEGHVGTSAPGTAIALDRGIQIRRAEHFNALAHPWSCTAVPIHDPDTGKILGVIDITGGDQAVAPQTLPLVEAAVAAMEAELRIQRLDGGRLDGRRLDAERLAGERTNEQRSSEQRSGQQRIGEQRNDEQRSDERRSDVSDRPDSRRRRSSVAMFSAANRAAVPVGFGVLGSDYGHLECGDVAIDVSPRHAEILTLLAWHREGLSADRLAFLLSDQTGSGQVNSVDTLRAEMVRVRKVLEQVTPSIVIGSRPYRLQSPLELDAQRVLAFLDRGAHRVALAAYRGPVLPNSFSPGIIDIRTEISARLREAMLTDASVDLLLEYARSDEATYDSEVWRACLELLPARSPKRATVVARLKRIDDELGVRQSSSQR